MEAARRDLARMRESSAAWQELSYESGDVNEVSRAKVLWALQYDRRSEDLPLLRFLAEQEALCCAHEPSHGLGEQAALAGFLLAGHRQVEDVWRHHAIKRANFDTACAYDVEHLFAGGVRATIDHVRDSDHPDRDEVLDLLVRAGVDEEDVEEWAEHRREWFPDDPADEDPLTVVERATLAGEKDLARAELDRWAAGRERDEGVLDTLRCHLIELDDLAEAARVQREALAGGCGDRVGALRRLASLERRAGNQVAAWEAMREWRQALEDVDGWRERGLGLGLARELYLLAAAAEGELADEVFAEAERQARDLPGLSPAVVEIAERRRGKLAR